MRADYDFSRGVRGKYLRRSRQGSNVVLLDADVQAGFPDSAAVNAALRALIAIGRSAARRRPMTARASGRATAKPAR